MNNEISCTYIGHATALIRMGTTTVLTDPHLGNRVLCARRRTPLGLNPQDLPDLSCVLISHAHCDHLHIPSYRYISCGTPIIVPEGKAKLLERSLSNPIIELSHYARHELVDGTEITAVPCIHSQSHLFNIGMTGSNAYLLRHPEMEGSVFFCGDSAYGPQFQEIGNLERIEMALLPIGGYEPRFLMRGKHMTPAEAVSAFEDLRAAHLIPIHHSTFRLSLENLDAPMAWLQKILEERPDLSHRIHPLQSGETFSFRPKGAEQAESRVA
jgi:L-ascorbate metabolism protein UlaG (beta-lactamase superfamily)